MIFNENSPNVTFYFSSKDQLRLCVDDGSNGFRWVLGVSVIKVNKVLSNFVSIDILHGAGKTTTTMSHKTLNDLISTYSPVEDL